jgi:hypothetical protein
MDITKIEAIYNNFISQNLLGLPNGNFGVNFQVPFTPDYLIVKSISYVPGNGDADSTNTITLDLLNPLTLGYFCIQTDTAPISFPNNYDTLFLIKKEVKGINNFQVGKGLTAYNGVLVIHLQWIKFKSEPPQAIL